MKYFVSIPHSGEEVPDECVWLKDLPESHLMRDVDRYVDRLYASTIDELGLTSVSTNWHRYVVDQNRLPEHIESVSVEGHIGNLDSFHKKGLHWVETTHGEPLLDKPMSMDLHKHLLKNYYQPFQDRLQAAHDHYKNLQGQSYQLDLHSMPSAGTKMHSDPGKIRPEIVISDFHAKSCHRGFVELVLKSFKEEFMDVSYNDPYIGGGITQKYGKPSKNQSCVQIELRRDMYMNEETKEYLVDEARELQIKLNSALKKIAKHL